MKRKNNHNVAENSNEELERPHDTPNRPKLQRYITVANECEW